MMLYTSYAIEFGKNKQHRFEVETALVIKGSNYLTIMAPTTFMITNNSSMFVLHVSVLGFGFRLNMAKGK